MTRATEPAPFCSGRPTGCPQIAAGLDPRLAAVRPAPPARGDDRAGCAARRVDGADPAGPQHGRPAVGQRLRPAESPIAPDTLPDQKEQTVLRRAAHFTDVHHHDHEALVALNLADGRGAGIARYIRHADNRQAAEIAVTIVDDWHGRGLGTELLARLSGRARHEGIHRFTGLVAEDNTAVIRMMQAMGASLAGRSPGTADGHIQHIYAKIGCSTRGAAVLFALRHNLAG